MEFTADNLPAEVHFFTGDAKHTISERKNCTGQFLFIFTKTGIFGAVVDGTKITCTANELVIALCRNYYQIVRYNKNVACYLVKVQWQFITDIKMSSQFIDLLVSRHILKTMPDSFDSKVINRIMKLLYYYYQSIRNPIRFPISSFNAALSLLLFQAAWQQDTVVANKGITSTRKELLTMQFLKLLVQHYNEKKL